MAEAFSEEYLSGDNVFTVDEHKLFDVKIKGPNSVGKITSFTDGDLKMDPTLVKNLASMGYTKPTSIQSYSLPVIQSKTDALFSSFTGTGKTASYLMAVINLINNGFAKNSQNWKSPKVLILAPTRELAEQIQKEAHTMTPGLAVTSMVVFGGDSYAREIRCLKQGRHSDILVATPGRLLDLLTNADTITLLELIETQILIIDEADEMFNLGFFPQLREIIKGHMKPKEERMTYMFSATFPKQIQLFAKKHLRDDFLHIIIGIMGAATPFVMQEILPVSQVEKAMRLKKILDKNPEKKTLVFCNTIERVESVVRVLNLQGKHPLTMHSELEQKARDQTIRNFQAGKNNLLVATSVAARGLNIKDCAIVINYDIPQKLEEYVQRIGRVRVFEGEPGVAISFFDENQDQEMRNPLKLVLTSVNQAVPHFLEEESEDQDWDDYYVETNPEVDAAMAGLRRLRFPKVDYFQDPEEF